ncbi:hypothetical protein OK18_02620 [Chryseobacterium gallinarum]|uniref:Glycosyltransferase 2-like domain-containing protein n=1 Tax=Chryseobacterium gallinarum TaxID=1324352 RepID=A0A0G3LYJ3_CHRGL|nr:glycosyltransferase family 2 protein [Chryseobacterium gallinarum]AKK71679.1 hypothetical protein OK18_02620 [Chryseobacterium gallinarum]
MISIIIVNYNTMQLTINCIASIYNYTKNINFEIIVVDNASSDNSVSQIREKFPDVRIVEAAENLGFGRANNLGASLAKGEYLFFLNSDTVFVENSLFKILDFFNKNENDLNIGVLGCLMIDENNEVNGFGSTFPSVASFNREIIKSIPIVGKFIENSTTDYNLNQEYFEVEYVLGADMFMRKALFDTVSGFDPNYFMYYEESDLQLIISRSQYKNYIFTGTKIIHLEGGSFTEKKKISNFKRIIVHTSRVYYAKKNFPKDYYKFKILDISKLLLSIFNYKYRFTENLKYITDIIKKY